MKKLVEVKNLSVKFDQEVVHDRLSFDIDEGEMLTILGPNGAGKSVLLKVLLGLLPYTGDVIWHKNSRIGYLPQSLNNLAVKGLPITVEDFFDLKEDKHTTEEKIEALKWVGLDSDILRRQSATLSGGQFQRMLVAWVLISKPDILFLDEPTTGIDVGGGENIYSLLDNLRTKSKLTVVLVTHDIHIVYAHSDHVLCLKRKSHACFGEPKKILTPQMLEKVFGMEIKFYQHR